MDEPHRDQTDILEEDQEWELERIVDHRILNGKCIYGAIYKNDPEYDSELIWNFFTLNSY